jgi:ribosomal protein S27E
LLENRQKKKGGEMENYENYDYKCPQCQNRDIVFKKIVSDKIVFHCNFCQEDFITKDKEESYLPQKIASLRKRYPAKQIANSKPLRL